MDLQHEKNELIKRLVDVEDKKTIQQVKAILMPSKKGVKEKERPYKPSMVKKIKQAQQDFKDGKGVKIKIEDLWK